MCGSVNLQALVMSCTLQEVVNAIVEAQSCGLGLAVNKISIGPNLPTISFIITRGKSILVVFLLLLLCESTVSQYRLFFELR